MGCDGHLEKAIYFLRPNGFTIMKVRRAHRGTGKRRDVRYWHLADISVCTAHVCFWGCGGHHRVKADLSALARTAFVQTHTLAHTLAGNFVAGQGTIGHGPAPCGPADPAAICSPALGLMF